MTTATIQIGTDLTGSKSAIRLPTADVLGRHGLVIGPTGSGKSWWMLGVLAQAVAAGRVGVVLVDMQGASAQALREILCVYTDSRRGPDPSQVFNLAPFGSHLPGLNLLDPLPGVSPALQARIASGFLSSLLRERLGNRMLPALEATLEAVIVAKGNLTDALEVLENPQAGNELAARLEASPHLAAYLKTGLPREPRQTLASLSARLRWLLALPRVRAMVSAPASVRAQQLIEAPVSIIDLGGVPAGAASLREFFGRWLFSILTSAAMARPEIPHSRPVVLVVDEFHVLADAAPGAFSSLLSRVRHHGVSLMLACQGPEQLDRELRSAVETNTAWTLAFRPSRQAAQRELLPYVDITGAMIDPALPDTTLSTAAERTLWLDRLSSLPPRHGCYLDRSRGQLRLLRTPNVPLDEFRARAAAKPRVMARVHAGAAAVPAHVLIQQMHAAEARKSAVAPAAVPSSSDTPRPSRSKPKKQPPLRLPK